MTCPTCGGEPILMGCLGDLDWFRCRACGWEWSMPDDPGDDPGDDLDDDEEKP